MSWLGYGSCLLAAGAGFPVAGVFGVHDRDHTVAELGPASESARAGVLALHYQLKAIRNIGAPAGV